MLVPLLLNNVLAAGHAVLAANAGSYAETGTAANLIKGSRISAGNGSYAVTGNANLTYTPVGHYTLAANGGSFTYTGADVGSIHNRILVATGGLYAISGPGATLSHINQGSVAGLRKTSTLSLSYPYTTELT